MTFPLRALRYTPPLPSLAQVYPFNLPLLAEFDELAFETPVTFLVGENGTGKSTLLEAIALAAGSVVAGAEFAGGDFTLDAVRKLGDQLKLVWNKRTRRGFFLRAEDFFGYVKRQNRLREDMQADLEQVEHEFADRSEYARGLAAGPLRGDLHNLENRYGGDLNARSHGESFLAFFQSRFVPDGLYLLDEPEAPLSPLRQLSLIAMLNEMVGQGAQFIIATHAPILMAFPGATVLSFDHKPIQAVPFESLEHVNLMRDFLNNPEQFLQHL